VRDQPRARLFVALELPGEARDGLVAWRGEALNGLDGLRLTASDHLHVTLCFLGWQPVGEIAAIAGECRLASAAAGWAGAELQLGPAVWLPPRRPRVLAVDLLEPEGAIGRLQAQLASRLEPGGWYTPEKRAFRAHVTVARVRKGARAPRRELAAPPRLRFPAAGLTLFRSHLSSGGARYEALASCGPVAAEDTVPRRGT
jgi:2'-5' RNA ligase